MGSVTSFFPSPVLTVTVYYMVRFFYSPEPPKKNSFKSTHKTIMRHRKGGGEKYKTKKKKKKKKPVSIVLRLVFSSVVLPNRPRMEKSHFKRHERSFGGLVSIVFVLTVRKNQITYIRVTGRTYSV